MATNPQKSRILAAVEALQACDRDGGVKLLLEELRLGPETGERWRSVTRLAEQIGETDIAIEAARRYAATPPVNLERLLTYWGELAQFGRTEQIHAQETSLPPEIKRQPNVLHFMGTVAGQEGDFELADRYYREALAQTPYLPQTWFALAMIKKFSPGDADLAAMEQVRPAMERAENAIRARFLYGLAKAWHDCGDFKRAFSIYSEGAELRRREERWDAAGAARFVDALIRDFTPEAMARLTPSGERRRAIFVNGMPRSGTTLVEQILVSHSQVAEGGEINLVRASLIPTGDSSWAGALNYQQKATSADPWGHLAASYFQLLEKRFRTSRTIVDKTLVQSHFMGLLVHMLPNARVVWMRRAPEDNALSCFRTFFTSGVFWSWSLADIGHFFKLEDRLFAHWSGMFPENILTVPYEQLAAAPREWIPRIAAHCGLEVEPQMFESHKTKRGVLTASVQQVRTPITTARIGQSEGYRPYLGPFREAYAGQA